MKAPEPVLSSLPAAAASPVRPRWDLLLALGTWGYPALCVVSLYLTWLAAWVALGHSPRPSLDDPKSIGAFVDAPYRVTMILLVGAPGAVVLGAIMTPIAVARRLAWRERRVLLGLVALVGFALLWGAAIGFLWADPWEVGNWNAD